MSYMTDERRMIQQSARDFAMNEVLPLANKRAYLDRYSEDDKSEYGLGIEARWPVPYWDIDAGMASMLILLSAVDQGLGAWFSGIFEGEGRDRF